MYIDVRDCFFHSSGCFLLLNKIHKPKAPRIIIANFGGCLGHENHMIVLFQGTVSEGKSATHAQVQEDRCIAFQVPEHILGPAAQVINALTDQALSKRPGKGKAKVRAVQPHLS